MKLRPPKYQLYGDINRAKQFIGRAYKEMVKYSRLVELGNLTNGWCNAIYYKHENVKIRVAILTDQPYVSIWAGELVPEEEYVQEYERPVDYRYFVLVGPDNGVVGDREWYWIHFSEHPKKTGWEKIGFAKPGGQKTFITSAGEIRTYKVRYVTPDAMSQIVTYKNNSQKYNYMRAFKLNTEGGNPRDVRFVAGYHFLATGDNSPIIHLPDIDMPVGARMINSLTNWHTAPTNRFFCDTLTRTLAWYHVTQSYYYSGGTYSENFPYTSSLSFELIWLSYNEVTGLWDKSWPGRFTTHGSTARVQGIFPYDDPAYGDYSYSEAFTGHLADIVSLNNNEITLHESLKGYPFEHSFTFTLPIFIEGDPEPTIDFTQTALFFIEYGNTKQTSTVSAGWIDYQSYDASSIYAVFPPIVDEQNIETDFGPIPYDCSTLGQDDCSTTYPQYLEWQNRIYNYYADGVSRLINFYSVFIAPSYYAVADNDVSESQTVQYTVDGCYWTTSGCASYSVTKELAFGVSFQENGLYLYVDMPRYVAEGMCVHDYELTFRNSISGIIRITGSAREYGTSIWSSILTFSDLFAWAAVDPPGVRYDPAATTLWLGDVEKIEPIDRSDCQTDFIEDAPFVDWPASYTRVSGGSIGSNLTYCYFEKAVSVPNLWDKTETDDLEIMGITRKFSTSDVVKTCILDDRLSDEPQEWAYWLESDIPEECVIYHDGEDKTEDVYLALINRGLIPVDGKVFEMGLV